MRFFTLALSMAMGIVLSAGSATASKQAVVRITFNNANNVFFASPGRLVVSGQGTVNDTVVVATVNTTAMTPTPSVMWPQGIASTTVSGTFSYLFTPMSTRTAYIYNEAATIMKSAPAAAASGGSTVPVPSSTTICFGSGGVAMPGPPSFPGSCFPKNGTLMRSPGVKKYGGVARLLGFVDSNFTRIGYPEGFDLGSAMLFYSQSPVFAVSSVGNYGITGSLMIYNTVVQVSRTSFNTRQIPPLTTGMVTAQGTNYGAINIYTGSNNLNVTNLTGMISLVSPQMARTYARSGGVFTGNPITFGFVQNVTLTFAGEVPEPGSLTMLALGTLGLGGLAIRRRR